MITTETKNLKHNLSRYLLHVRKGEDVLITVHGEPVARIVKEPKKAVSIRERLEPLAANGLIELPLETSHRKSAEPVEVPGKRVSDLIIEDRR